MTSFLFFIFGLECLALIIWGMRDKGRIYEFPFLAGAAFGGFIFVQLLGLSNDDTLPKGAIDKTAFMSILCLGACYVGYIFSNKPFKLPIWSFDKKYLRNSAIILVVIGGYFYLKIWNRGFEEMQQTWTGTIVRDDFFANVLIYGLIIALFLFLKYNSKLAFILLLISSLFYFNLIVLLGRRYNTSEYFFVTLCMIWFLKRKTIPKYIMLIFLFIATLLVHNIGEYRGKIAYKEDPAFEELKEIPFFENFKQILQEGGFEGRNAVMMIETQSRTGGYDFGLYNYNTLIFNYVPAQIVGQSFKKKLMISPPDVIEKSYQELGHLPSLGSTNTGITDAFCSFWYFGFIKFLLIAYIMKRLYLSAVSGNTLAQFLYSLIVTPALHSITHHTQWFFSAWVHMGLFLIPPLIISRKKQGLL